MSDHETIRKLLALSAAGLLEPGEERLVQEHVRQCAGCAAKLDDYATLSAGLSALPCPLPLPDLLRRTNMLVAAELDRRQGAVLAGTAAIFRVCSDPVDRPGAAHAGGRHRRHGVARLGRNFFRNGRSFRSDAGSAPPS